MWGLIIPCIQKHFLDAFGEEYDEKLISELLYNQCPIKQTLQLPNPKTGELQTFEIEKRMSGMLIEEMTHFISLVLDWCDAYDIVLPAEARYLWIYDVNPRYVDEIRERKFPDNCPEYLAHVRKSYCLICGKYMCDAHHVKDHNLAGLGAKTPDYMALPLCHDCHVRADGHATTAWISQFTPWITKYYDWTTFLKLCFDRWLKHK